MVVYTVPFIPSYKSDLVSSLPQRPSNAGAHPPMFLGVCGLLFALLVGSGDKNATGIAVGIGVISVVFLLAGTGTKKSPELVKWADRIRTYRSG
jgi:hypothetical protein